MPHGLAPTTHPPTTDPRWASTLAHGLAVLEAFIHGPPAQSNQALARATGLSKATISRLSTPLLSRGLLAFDGGSRCYRLGPATLTLGYPLLAGLDIRRRARLPMKRLADDLGAAVSLGMWDRHRMVYLETSRSSQTVGFAPDVGAALPLLSTAIGRAWLASAEPALRRQAWQALRAARPDAIARWAPAAASAARRLHHDGHVTAAGHWRPEVWAVAVPLRLPAPPGAGPLVLTCGLPAGAPPARHLHTEVAPRLRALARQVEQDGRGQAGDDPAGASALPSPAATPPAPTPTGATPPRPADAALPPAVTLARGLDLLLCFQPGRDAWGNGALAQALGLAPATVARLTHTLTTLGYLRRDSQSARYPCHRPGPATLALAYPLLHSHRVRQVARPLMQALAQRLGGAVSLGLAHQARMIYLETAWQADGRLMPPDTGAPMPMLGTAMGRAWLAQAAPAQRQAVLHQIRLQSPEDLRRWGGALDAAIEEFATRGACSSRGALRPDVFAFAVPLSQPVDGTRLVLNCGLLASRQGFDAARRQAVPALQALVREVEAGLGLQDRD